MRYPCPACKAIAVDAVTIRDDSIQEASFACPDGHLFIIKWLRPPLSDEEKPCSSRRMKSGPGGAGHTHRDLTHHFDYGEGGLAHQW